MSTSVKSEMKRKRERRTRILNGEATFELRKHGHVRPAIGYLLSVQASGLRPRLRTRQARLPLQAPRYHRSAEFQQEGELNG
jgi:hypothetical protein